MTSQRTLLTGEDLLNMQEEGRRYELLDGELVDLGPSNSEHNWIAVNISAPLHAHVKAARLGYVMAGDTGIYLRRNPDRLRAPDVCFFAVDKFPEGRPPATFAEILPDFLVEIVSPSDSATYVEQKIQEWLLAGVRMVWAVYPETRSVTVYRGLSDIRVYREAEIIEGAPVFPDFTLPVAEIFS